MYLFTSYNIYIKDNRSVWYIYFLHYKDIDFNFILIIILHFHTKNIIRITYIYYIHLFPNITHYPKKIMVFKRSYNVDFYHKCTLEKYI